MTVDVLIPVYNQEELIKRAVRSIPAGCNTIICDDGSTDNTLKSIAELSDERSLTLISNSKNKGVSHTLNRLYAEARSDYVVVLASDDYFYPEITKVLELLDGTDLIYFDMINNKGKRWSATPETVVKYSQSIKFIRTEIIKDIRLPEDMTYMEDVWQMRRILEKNPTMTFTGILGKHYNHPRAGSLSYVGRKTGKKYVEIQ